MGLFSNSSSRLMQSTKVSNQVVQPPSLVRSAQRLRSSSQHSASALLRNCQKLQQIKYRSSSSTAVTAFSNVETPARGVKHEKVGDVMTRGHVHSVTPDTTVDEALEILVNNSVTGLPVLDEDGSVVGVVSDYDLLSLEGITEVAQESTGMFPELSMEWNTFRAVQRLITKNAGKTVADVMTEEPLVVRPETNMAAAAKILLDSKIRRLPVVDESGRLVGIFTRRDVIRAALKTRKAAAGL